MKLRDFVKALPRGQRQLFREKLAKAHGRSVALVRKWENWPPPDEWSAKETKSQARRHPADLDAIGKTEELTDKMVTRFDLRPECWTNETID